MSYAPSIRMIRESIEAQARAGSPDAVGIEALRGDIERTIQAVRRGIERARDFGVRGLVSEAASVVEDHPDLARQAQELAGLPRASPVVERFWSVHVDNGAEPVALPTADEIDQLVMLVDQAARLRQLLDALRAAALRREPIGNRLAILKKLREADTRNRLWLDQIDSLEREWIKRIGEMRGDSGASREELEEAFTALSSRQWVAPVPRGLKDEIYTLLKPLRADEAGERYAELAGRIHDASALMDRVELERLEAAWATVFHETGRMPSPDLQAMVSPGFEWLGRAAEDDRRQAEFDGLVERLERALDARRPGVEIERQLAQIMDAGRSAPEGVVGRAHAWIEAERDRTRRRHRVILVAAVAAAAVTVAAGALAVSAYSRTKERESAVAALEALLAKGDSPAARALAGEIRAKPELMVAELAALLSREEQLFTEWNAERASMAALFDAMARQLEQAQARARLVEMAAQIESARARVRTKEEESTLDALSQRHADRMIERDKADGKAAEDVLAEVDRQLRDWPLPERWDPAQLNDPARWAAYLATLETARGALERGRADIAGAEVAESRVKLRQEGIEERITEAKSRREELAAALADLAPARLGAGVSVESDLVARLDGILAKRGATLQRMGALGSFEAAKASAPAWSSIQVWRDEAYPRIELALRNPADPAAAATAIEAMQAFVARFPDTPYRARIEELQRRIDPAAKDPIWMPERVRGALADHFYAGLEEVPLAGGDRFFYRRSSDQDRDPLHRAIENLADVQLNPDRLNALLLKRGEQLAGTVRTCALSASWAQAEAAVASADPSEVQGILLDLLERVRGSAEGDAILRARALRDLAVLLRQGGYVPAAAAAPLEEWLGKCARHWSESLSTDWARAAYDPPSNIRNLRRGCEAAISEFPKLKSIVESASAERDRARAEVRPLAPIGVLLPAESEGAARVLGEARDDGPVVLVGRDGLRWRFVEASLVGNRIELTTPGVPAGPVLVFRRIGR